MPVIIGRAIGKWKLLSTFMEGRYVCIHPVLKHCTCEKGGIEHGECMVQLIQQHECMDYVLVTPSNEIVKDGIWDMRRCWWGVYWWFITR